MYSDEEVDYTKLKYALYARKSTDDTLRQQRSIEDQLDECLKFATSLNLHIVGDPIIEKHSAMKANKRPLFRKMLDDLKRGKYDGIIAWSPDRLARNSLEGGEIIYMIDEGHIKDLKFVSYTFTNDPSGKMLLGIFFSISKEYSDKLSVDVSRGVRKSLLEGKGSGYKHGYVRDDDGLQHPDGKNFELICAAWKKRANGISLEAIAEYMKEQGYTRTIKNNGKKVLLTKQMLSTVFKDSFYYGVLKQKNEEVDLFSMYDFQPATTEKDYLVVQQLSGRKLQPYIKKRATYYPLKMMVTCSICGNHMYAGAVQGHVYKYLTYRCDNKYCKRVKKSIRGKVIFDFIYELLEKGLSFGEKEYKQYLSAMKGLSGSRLEKAEREIHSKEARLKVVEREAIDTAIKMLNFAKDSPVIEIYEKRVADLKSEGTLLKADLVELKKSLPNPEEEVLTYENFLNLCRKAGTAIQTKDPVIKDAICRLLFLNFSVDESKVLSYQAKPAFEELLKTRFVLYGRGKRT